MANEEKPVTEPSEQSKSRGSRDRQQKKDKPKPLTRVIIRRLPPTMTEEEFLRQIDPLPEYDFYYYAAADWSLGLDATCRAYITFRNLEDVFLFRDRFDGYVFVDTKGEEYPAVVEFAPFQGLPKNKARKVDPKVNTIENGQHYITFLQKLEEDREASKSECKLEFSLQPKDDKKVTSTPLLQFLINKKMERREEQKKRNEDKRRRRDEEKRKRRDRVSKGIPSSIKEEGAAAKDSKQKTEGSPDNPEEKKNSRAKRRAERDQRRCEEHEQRRREKERERVAETEQKILQAADQQPADKEAKKHVTIAKPLEGEHKLKEVKKYSERRERDRHKNSQNSTAAVDSESGNPKCSIATTADDEKLSAKEDNAMVKFMKNLSKVKEFVPKHKQKEAAKGDKKPASTAVDMEKTDGKSADTGVDLEEVKEKLEKISLLESDELKNQSPEREDEPVENKSERSEWSKRKSSSSGGYANDGKSEERMNRRIRNKDRPSIAIYQPVKSRLRSAEDGQPNNDEKSNPNSDTESLKKDERPNTAHKVSRYSERRSGRAGDGKRRYSEDDKTVKASENTATDGCKDEQIEKTIDAKKKTEKAQKESNR